MSFQRGIRVDRDEKLPTQDTRRPVEVYTPRAELRNCLECNRYVYCYLTSGRHLCGRCRRVELGKA